MRYLYCLLFGILMFMGCSKDAPEKDSNLVTVKFSMNSPTAAADKSEYFNEFEIFYSKSIDVEITFKVRFTGGGVDTTFDGVVEKGLVDHPAGFGDPLIIGYSKTFSFVSKQPAGKVELISITSSDPKYKFKMLPPRNLTD